MKNKEQIAGIQSHALSVQPGFAFLAPLRENTTIKVVKVILGRLIFSALQPLTTIAFLKPLITNLKLARKKIFVVRGLEQFDNQRHFSGLTTFDNI